MLNEFEIEIKSLNVFGLKVSNFTMDEIEKLYNSIIKQKKSIILYGYSFGFIPKIKLFPDLYNIINSSDVLLCDGTQFNWFCSFLGFKIKTVKSIPEMCNYSLNYANRNNLKVLLFGATKDINNLAISNLKKLYPNIVFCQGIDGYFNQSDEIEVVKKIKQHSPDILFIGISTPIKERFAFTYKNDLNSSIIIPCGGMIDVYSGLTKQTPKFIKQIGFATPYRIIQEPKRLLKLNLWVFYEIFCKFIPITLYQKYFLRKKDFNVLEIYISTTKG